MSLKGTEICQESARGGLPCLLLATVSRMCTGCLMFGVNAPRSSRLICRFVTVLSVIISKLHCSNYCSGTITTNKCTSKCFFCSFAQCYVSGGGSTYSLSQIFGSSAGSCWKWMQNCLSPPRGWKQKITKKCLCCASLSKIDPLSAEFLHRHTSTASCPVACFPQKTRHSLPQTLSHHSQSLLSRIFLGETSEKSHGDHL